MIWIIRLLQLAVLFGAGWTAVRCAYWLGVAPRKLVITVIRHDAEKVMLAGVSIAAYAATIERWWTP